MFVCEVSVACAHRMKRSVVSGGPAKRSRAAQDDASLAHFPIDVLRLIASFVPQRPRLLVLSFVSKRWRTAVIHSIDYLRLHGRDSPRALALLPGITSISVAPNYTHFGAAVLPPSITHVAFEPNVEITELHDAGPFAALTRITSLKIAISVTHESTTPKLLNFLRTHASSIETLVLNMERALTPLAAAPLPPLPRLRPSVHPHSWKWWSSRCRRSCTRCAWPSSPPRLRSSRATSQSTPTRRSEGPSP